MGPAPNGTEHGDGDEPRPSLDFPGQDEVVERVYGQFGDRLNALASMRDRAYQELSGLPTTRASFGGTNAYLLMVFGYAIGVLDAARILMEHGYGRRALGLVRTLVDLEIDALLLVANGSEVLERYAAYERWEVAVTAARGLYTLDPDDPVVAPGVRNRVADLTQALQEMGVDISGIDDTDLVTALEEFGRHALGKPYPRSWRDHLNPDEMLDIVAPAHVRTFHPGMESSDPEAFEATVDQRKRDHKLGYGLMSSILHASPRTLAQSVQLGADGYIKAFIVGGDLADVDLASGMAGLHFYRIRQIVSLAIGYSGDEDVWDDDFAAIHR